MPFRNNIDLNKKGESTPPSKVDLFSGIHTNSLIVGTLFILTLIGILILVLTKENISDNLITGLIGILGVLAGFFAATLNNKNSSQ